MEKKIVVPGEVVTTERKKLLDNVFTSEGSILSSTIGIAQVSDDAAGVIALRGKYMPKNGDLVIGIVKSENQAGYIVNVNSFYRSFVLKKMMVKPLRIGDVISAKIVEVNEVNEMSLGDIRVFYGGEILCAEPTKVPRMIGRQGSMLNVLKNGTGSSLMIGRNGWIWVKGGNLDLLKEAICKIEEESHLSNLTNRIESYLAEKNGKGLKEDKGELNE